MKSLVFALMVLSMAPISRAQQISAQKFTDPLALLQAVARNYGSASDKFRLESINDFDTSDDLDHQWSRSYSTVIKGPGNHYRIEVRTGFGSLMQLSDGSNEWIYQVESNAYVKRPLPPDWPRFPKVKSTLFKELSEAWNQRTFLEDEALSYKRATMMPDQTIVVEGKRYPCYVVRADSDDSTRDIDKDYKAEATYWIDKQTLVFRRIRRIADGTIMLSKNVRLPSHYETTETFPDFETDPETTAEMFRFTPPADANEVASLEPNFSGPPPSEPSKTQMVGQIAPDVVFAGQDGKRIELSSYRGKPMLIDFWATWCGSCLVSMPALNRIYSETKDKGLQVIGLDQNAAAEDAAIYLRRHNYGWANYHDERNAVFKALNGNGIPLVVLLDSHGKIIYYGFGDDEGALRKAIAGLGPEFASVATSR